MRHSYLLVGLATAVTAACAGNQRIAEPQLAGGESPAAFQRAIGVTLLKAGEPRRALPYLQRLVRLEPGRAEPRCYLGRAFMDMAMWQQARSSIDEAIALEPRYAPAHALLGVLLDARGDHQAAAEAHGHAIALDPGNAAYHNNLGFSRYLEGRYPDARAAFDAALRLDPKQRRIHNNLGFTFGKLDLIEDASEHFRLAGTPAEAANNLGVVFEDLGQLERAYDAFATAVREAPDLAAARGNLQRICEQLGKPLPAVLERRE